VLSFSVWADASTVVCITINISTQYDHIGNHREIEQLSKEDHLGIHSLRHRVILRVDAFFLVE
jgi:hypothetical protein